MTEERLSRRSFGGLPLQHQLEEALQLFVMLKNGMAMKERLLYVGPISRKKTYLVWVL